MSTHWRSEFEAMGLGGYVEEAVGAPSVLAVSHAMGAHRGTYGAATEEVIEAAAAAGEPLSERAIAYARQRADERDEARERLAEGRPQVSTHEHWRRELSESDGGACVVSMLGEVA